VLAIQQACVTVPGLQLRIGIHLGDVVFENHDVFGDGVNIASRIQALAPIGGIWVSESVHKNISNKKEICSRFIKEELLKNVKDPIRIYEVSVEIQAWMNPALSNTSPKSVKIISKKSIAVLPFVNMSNDPEQDYFSDGMAEEILNSLAHLNDLKVAGRTSAFQFKGKNMDLRDVGEKLGVRNVLEGSVRKYGNKLRVTAQLINVEDGFHLWSEKYDRDIDDIFAIQDEIAFAITEKLRITLFAKDREFINKTPTQNTEAYELYLKGRFNINRRGKFIPIGLDCFNKAIAIDHDFALAYAGLADACLLTVYYSFKPAKEVMPKAKQAADTAIRLDSSLCEPYTSLGFYYGFYEWNWTASKKNFCKALEMNPGYATGHSWYGMLYLSWIECNNGEAIKEGRAAIKLEPLSAIAHSLQIVIYMIAGKYVEAINMAKVAIELDPNSYLAHHMSGLVYAELGKFEEAVDMMQAALRITNRFPWALFDLAWVYSRTGNWPGFKEIINELDARAEKEYISPFLRGLAAAQEGYLDLAMIYLEKSYQIKDPVLISIKTWPNVPGNLKNDPRCQDLIKRINFPE
jgi:TolB-like protein